MLKNSLKKLFLLWIFLENYSNSLSSRKNDMKRKKERSRCNLERERERFRNVTRTNFASSPRRWGKLKFPLPLRPIYHGKLFNEVSHRVSRAWKVPLAGRLWYRDGETASSLALETGTGTGERERGYATGYGGGKNKKEEEVFWYKRTGESRRELMPVGRIAGRNGSDGDRSAD